MANIKTALVSIVEAVRNSLRRIVNYDFTPLINMPPQKHQPYTAKRTLCFANQTGHMMCQLQTPTFKVDNRIQWEYGSLALPLKLSRFSIGSRLAHIRVRFFTIRLTRLTKALMC